MGNRALESGWFDQREMTLHGFGQCIRQCAKERREAIPVRQRTEDNHVIVPFSCKSRHGLGRIARNEVHAAVGRLELAAQPLERRAQFRRAIGRAMEDLDGAVASA